MEQAMMQDHELLHPSLVIVPHFLIDFNKFDVSSIVVRHNQWLYKRHDIDTDNWEGYLNIGPPSGICNKCGSCMWLEERNNKSRRKAQPTYSLCCRDGFITLPPEDPPPPLLASLLFGGPKTTHVSANIRVTSRLFGILILNTKLKYNVINWKFYYKGDYYKVQLTEVQTSSYSKSNILKLQFQCTSTRS